MGSTLLEWENTSRGLRLTPDSPKQTLSRTIYGKAMILDPWGTDLIDDPAGQHEEGAFWISE